MSPYAYLPIDDVYNLAVRCAWTLVICSAIGSVSGSHWMFDVAMALAPLAPLVLGLGFGAAYRALGLHAIGMAVVLVTFAHCVRHKVGLTVIVLPWIQLVAVPSAVALVHVALEHIDKAIENNAKVEALKRRILNVLHLCVRVLFAIAAFAIAALVTTLRTAATIAGETTPALFCRRARDPSTGRVAAALTPGIPEWFGAFVNLLILHALFENAARAWSATELRVRKAGAAKPPRVSPSVLERARAHFRDAVWAMAGEPPTCVLWAALGSTGWWDMDCEIAVVLECVGIVLRSTAAIFKGDSADIVIMALWDSLPKVLQAPATHVSHLASFPALTATVLLGQLFNAASPWGCIPHPIIAMLATFSMLTAASRSYRKHVASLKWGAKGTTVAARLALWDRSPLLCGICAATMPAGEVMAIFERELCESDEGLGDVGQASRDSCSGIRIRRSAGSDAEGNTVGLKQSFPAGDAAFAADAQTVEAVEAATKAAELAQIDLARAHMNQLTLVERRLDAIVNKHAAHGSTVGWELRIATLVWAHFAPHDVPGGAFAALLQGRFHLIPAECNTMEEAIILLLGATPLFDRVEDVVTGIGLPLLHRSVHIDTELARPGVSWAIAALRKFSSWNLSEVTRAPCASGNPSNAGDFSSWNLSEVARTVIGFAFPKARKLLLDSKRREDIRRTFFLTDAEARAKGGEWSWSKKLKQTPVIGAALANWAIHEVDLFSSIKGEAMRVARARGPASAVSAPAPTLAVHPGCAVKERESPAQRASERANPSSISSGAFKFSLHGAIAADTLRVYTVDLKNCALYNLETVSQAGRRVGDPKRVQWRALKEAWKARDAAASDPDGIVEKHTQMLRVRPELLHHRNDDARGPEYARRHHWFPARIDVNPDDPESDKRFETLLESGMLPVRYIHDALPTLGSADNVLLIKQNKVTDKLQVAGKALLTGEIKVVGMTIDADFPSPDDLQISVTECTDDGSNPPLGVHDANHVTAAIAIVARDAALTIDADPDNIEFCLGNSVVNWVIRKVMVAGSGAPVPVHFPHVRCAVDLTVGLVAPAGRSHPAPGDADPNPGEATSGIALSIQRIDITPGEGSTDLTPDGFEEWPELYRQVWARLDQFTSLAEGIDGKRVYFNKITAGICAATTDKIVVPWKKLRLAAPKGQR